MPGAFDRAEESEAPRGAFERFDEGEGDEAEDLQASIAETEGRLREKGVREFGPGLMGLAQRGASSPISQTVLDLVSRPNYAVAGAFEERMAGKGPMAATGRAAREMLSGLGEIKGEKRAFGEVLERAGVPEMGRLSQTGILPSQATGEALAGQIESLPFGINPPTREILAGLARSLTEGGPLDVTGRGSLGLVLDVAADPTTPLSFGAGKGGQVLTKEGIKILSRKGMRKAASEVARLVPEAAIEAKTARLVIERLPEESRAIAQKIARERAAAEITGAFHATEEGGIVPKALSTIDESDVIARSKLQDYWKKAENSRAYRDLVDQQTQRMLGEGFKKGEEPFRAFGHALQEEVKQRIALMARTNPRLLDRGGMKWAGLTVPYTPEMGALMSKKTAQAIGVLRGAPVVGHAVRGADAAMDYAGKLIGSRDWRIRNLPMTVAMKQDHLDYIAVKMGEAISKVENSQAFNWLRKQGKDEALWQRLMDAAESGRLEGLAPIEQQVVRETREIFDEQALLEHEIGRLPKIRKNYIPHFYDNTDDELRAIFKTAGGTRLWRSKQLDFSSLGRHKENRAFDTVAEAKEYAKEMGSQIELKPVLNPIELIIRRSRAHANTVGFDSWYKWIAANHGKMPDFNIQRMYNLAADEQALSMGEIDAVERALKAGDSAPAMVEQMTKDGKAAFMRAAISKITTREQLESFLKKYDRFVGDMPKRMADEIPNDAFGKPMVPAPPDIDQLKGMYIPVEIRDDMEDMADRLYSNRDLEGLVKNFDTVNNFTKSMLTIPFPAFHARNAYSNVAQAFLEIGFAALDPRMHKDAFLVLAGRDGVLRTKLGDVYTYQELRDLAKRYRVTISGADILELTGQRKMAGRVVQDIREAGGTIENKDRMLLFMYRIRHGDDPLTAAQRVKDVLVDYQNMTRFEKDWVTRGVPFYQWPKKNLIYQWKKLRTRPGLASAQIDPFRGRESENDKLATWEGEAMKIRLNADGKTLRVLTGVDLPIRSTDLIWAGSLGKTLSRQIGMLQPGLRAIPEIGLNRVAFTGRELSQPVESESMGRALENAPAPVKRLIGWQKSKPDAAGRVRYTFDGERFYILFQAWAMSRMVSTTERQFKYLVDNQSTARAYLDVLTGLRDKDLNLDEQQIKKLKERKAYMERLAARAGIGYTYQQYVPPKEEEETEE